MRFTLSTTMGIIKLLFYLFKVPCENWYCTIFLPVLSFEQCWASFYIIITRKLSHFLITTVIKINKIQECFLASRRLHFLFCLEDHVQAPSKTRKKNRRGICRLLFENKWNILDLYWTSKDQEKNWLKFLRPWALW